MGGRGRALWAAWALALAGGISVLIAAVLVVRSDAGLACTRGFPCAPAFPAGTTTLALVGTVMAVVGGIVATVLAVRQLDGRGRDERSGDRGPGTGVTSP